MSRRNHCYLWEHCYVVCTELVRLLNQYRYIAFLGLALYCYTNSYKSSGLHWSDSEIEAERQEYYCVDNIQS